MSSTLLRTRATLTLRPLQSLRAKANYATGTKDWSGRQPSEHITNRTDNLNVQASASHSGQEDRSKGDPSTSEGGGGHSQATTQKDKGNQNEQAQKDHPEAPGPVIGMNDERGQVIPLARSTIVGERWADEVCFGIDGT